MPAFSRCGFWLSLIKFMFMCEQNLSNLPSNLETLSHSRQSLQNQARL
ncbi:hypothetical protein CAMRE0001_3104 [Campylobacter rectus RM3267]|uniref:Uncharacterized protein n=1 Tax=Campylobacter rectus RM3267 TaxID=553218 RepID=B9D4Q5_CAMRE|nr:hypothetical protein CAMRE0001_3104 [Campylobacter rectus RM3267]